MKITTGSAPASMGGGKKRGDAVYIGKPEHTVHFENHLGHRVTRSYPTAEEAQHQHDYGTREGGWRPVPAHKPVMGSEG